MRVVIAGGGVAALEALFALRNLAGDLVSPVVVSMSEDFVYRPLLVAESFGLGSPRTHRLRRLCASVGASVIIDRVTRVDVDAHAVHTADGQQVEYDVLLVALGARPYPAFEHGITFDRETSPEDFEAVLFDVEDGFVRHVAIVVPPGVAWALPAYELALMTPPWAQRRGLDVASVTLVTHERAPLELFGPTASDGVAALLRDQHVEVRCGVRADPLSPTALRANGGWMTADRIVSLPLLSGPRLAGLPADLRGFIPVGASGEVLGAPDVYVAGDSAAMPIKQGGLAAQQAAVVAGEIADRVGAPVKHHVPPVVLRGLLHTPVGSRFLRAELDDVPGTSAISTEPLWWPPSKVASRWLAPHLARLEAEEARGVVSMLG